MLNIQPQHLLSELIALRTVTHQCSEESINSMESLLVEYGFKVFRVVTEGDVHFLAEMGEGSRTMAFIGHYDVVPAGDSLFSPQLGDEVIYGRGACDMKGALAAMILAAPVWVEKGWRVVLMIAGDEETNSRGMPALLKACPHQINFALGGEPTAKMQSGDSIKLGRRGVLQGTITFQGQSGHAAYPEQSLNILHNLGKIISVLAEPFRDSKNGMPSSTLTITGIETESTATNVIPSWVKLRFDARISPNCSLKQLEKIITSKLTNLSLEFSIEITKRTESYCVERNTVVDQIIQELKQTLNLDIAVLYDGGTSDMRFLRDYKIPMLELGLPSLGIHGDQERVSVKNLQQLTEIYQKISEIVHSTIRTT